MNSKLYIVVKEPSNIWDELYLHSIDLNSDGWAGKSVFGHNAKFTEFLNCARSFEPSQRQQALDIISYLKIASKLATPFKGDKKKKYTFSLKVVASSVKEEIV